MKGNLLRLVDLKKNSEWCDKDRVFLYACFQILVDFIEKEKPQKIVDYNYDKNHRRQWKELRALYHYWKVERPRLEKRADRTLTKSGISMVPDPPEWPGAPSCGIRFTFKDKRAFNLHCRLDDKLDRLDDDMLRRLVTMRRHLFC